MTKAENTSFGEIISDNLFKQNPMLVSGFILAPCMAYVTTLERALTLTAAFSMITFYTLILSSLVPQDIVYTIKVILYTLIGAAVFIPSAIILYNLMPQQIDGMGVFFPLLITNPIVLSCSEGTLFQTSRGRMLMDVFFSIIGCDIAVVLFGAAREIFSTGEIMGKILPVPMIFQGISAPFGGFILLGLFAALLRAIVLLVRKIQS